MRDPNCIFCKIGRKEIPSDVVLETEDTIVFKDVNPKAPTHLLVVPKSHVESVATLSDKDAEMAGKLVVTAREVAEREGVTPGGFRLVFNVGKDSGSEVDHLHLHILGGRPLGGMG
jgi:histidine triad (HIT) family protein